MLKVDACDVNLHQIYLTALRHAALLRLDNATARELLGIWDPAAYVNDEQAQRKRRRDYQSLREHLREDARTFWDSPPGQVLRSPSTPLRT